MGRLGSSGFTLIEAITVVVVLGILASVGIPHYQKSVERGIRRQAQEVVTAIFHGERSYFLLNNFYFPASGMLSESSPMADWRKIYMDNPNLGSVAVRYTVTGGTTLFTATTTRTAGACNGKTLTIDQARNPGGDWPENGAC